MALSSDIRVIPIGRSSNPLGQITQAGRLRNSRGIGWDKMRVLGEWALVYLLRGGGIFQDAHGFSRKVAAGDLLILFPTVGHVYGPVAGEAWDEIFVCFRGEIFKLWERLGLLDPAQPVFHLEPIARWRKRIEQCLVTPEGMSLDGLEAVCRLQTLLVETVHRSEPKKGTREAWVALARQLLQHIDVGNALGLDQVASRCGMSYESFRKQFSAATGLSPGRYRNLQRIERAQELMRQQDLANKQVAAALGFADEFHFSRIFKQITGRSPREYRRQFA